jgi:transposase-like protein
MNNTTTPLGGYEIDMSEIVQQVCNNGLDGIDKVMSKLLNVAMQIEREQYLHARAYERSSDRLGYCNGYKEKSMKTRIGKLDLHVPQVRGAGVEFYPSCLEKGIRSERALTMSLAQMYIQGVSSHSWCECGA